MRLIGRLLFALLLLIAVGYGWYAIDLNVNFKERPVKPWEDNYERFITYLIRPQQTLHFDVPNDATQIRILHTPVGLADEEETAEFAFQSEGRAALSETYTLSVAASPEGLKEQQPPVRFFQSPDGPLAGVTKFHIVSFPQRQPPGEFSITLKEGTRPFAIRVAVLEQFDEKSVARVWQRMADDKKQSFFEDHIYPMALIPEAERTARLTQRWRPIGPTSQSSEAVVSQTLFVDEQLDARTEAIEATDELAVIGPQRWITVDTQAQQAIETAACRPLIGSGPVKLTRAAITAEGHFSSQQIQLQSESQRMQLPALKQRYRFSADKRCELSFYDANGERVTVDNQYLRGAVASVSTDLRFALVGDSEQVQPIRLDARLVTLDGTELPDSMKLDWTIIDQSGRALLQGQLTPRVTPNPYQVTVDSSLLSTVHEKQSEYIVAPATASELKLRLTSAEAVEGADVLADVLVNVYTRPVDLAYQVEQSDEDEPQQQQLPKWFISRSIGQSNGVPAETRLLSWQTPLSEPVAGEPQEEHWYGLTSLEQAPYFELFLEEQHSAVQAVDSGLAFYPINPDEFDYKLTADAHNQAVTPQLVYQKAAQNPVAVRLSINGNKLRDDWLYASSGKLFLPSMAQGDYQLSLSTGTPVSWYSNYQAADKQSLYRVRSAYRLVNRLTFDVDKAAGEEWVTFNYFPSTADPHQVSIRVEKRDRIGVFSDYTVAERTFSIAAREQSPTVSLLNQDMGAIWQPLRLPFLLGSDLDAGSYRITVTSSSTSSGYVQAGYLASPPDYQTEIYKENENAPF